MKKTVTLLLLLAMTLSLTSCNKAAEDSYSSASAEQTTEQPQEISPTKLTNKMSESELATVSKHALTLLDEPPKLSSDPNAEHKVSIEFQTIDIENWRSSINENRDEMTDDKLTVTVGSVEHPMVEEHYIEWISVQTKFGNQRKALRPGERPEAVFALLPGDEVIAVYEYCNLHGLWKA